MAMVQRHAGRQDETRHDQEAAADAEEAGEQAYAEADTEEPRQQPSERCRP